jgi:hypothetical protein
MKCPKHKKEMKLLLPDVDEDTGWHCDKCNSLYNLSAKETRIFDCGFQMGRSSLTDKVKQADKFEQLKKLILEQE